MKDKEMEVKQELLEIAKRALNSTSFNEIDDIEVSQTNYGDSYEITIEIRCATDKNKTDGTGVYLDKNRQPYRLT